MLILLPPSETKRVGGSGVFTPETLRHHELLGAARSEVRCALEDVSTDEAAATQALKLGTKNRAEREHNLVLERSGVLPAIERYTGVLYDALDAPSLDDDARGWIAEHVAVQSALFGVVGAADAIPAYRLSAGSRLPGLASPLKRVWTAAHAEVPWERSGLVLDLRSKDYAALAPLPAGLGWFLNVAQRAPDGAVRALNHFNKAAKGDLVRRMALSGETPDEVTDLLGWAERQGLELHAEESTREITLVTELGAPGRG